MLEDLQGCAPLKALTFEGARRLAWHDVPGPVIADGRQAVVRPIASTTCDLDQRIIAGRSPFEPPFAIGHECVAEVVDIGSSVRSVKPGDVVVVPWHFFCGECDRCRAGVTASCEAVGRYACFGIPIGGHWGGLFSDLALVPFADAMLVPVPEGVDPAAAVSVSDNLTDAWIGVSKGLARHPGAKVLVHGGVGSLGMYAVQLALAAGAESVDYIDPDASRRTMAKSLGAIVHEVVDPSLFWRFPVVINATRDVAEMRLAIQCLSPGGHLSGLAIFFQDAPMPLWELYVRDATFSAGIPSVRPHIPRVLELLRCGHVHPERVTSRIIQWDDAAEALAEPSLKPVVVRPALFTPAGSQHRREGSVI